MNRSHFSKTPTLAVLDNRGLTVRGIAYCRHPDTPGVTDERITRHRYDGHGFLKQSVDPRLHAAGLVNFSYQADLTGHVLRAQGADNGTTLALNDAAGRPFVTVSNIGATDAGSDDRSLAVIHRRYYEEADLPGRPLSISEQLYAEEARVSERFIYGENTLANQDLNLSGQCVSHYDTAGLVQTDAIALTGVALSVTRRLMKDADNPDTLVDWHGENACDWNGLLAAKTYSTHTLTDATGANLITTDAAGNLQRTAYSVAGLLSGSWVTVKGAIEQVIVKSLEVSAAGQKLREEHGNGVVTIYTYEPTTQRLDGINVQRPAGHAAGAKVLQDLRYGYDPVGNVLNVRNDAEETRFWRNQTVVPDNTYRYDSLYQLVAATGREMANAGQQRGDLPPVTHFDSATYTNYSRTYEYDRALNLTRIRHCAFAVENNYTTDITLSDSSNRGVLSTLTENPTCVSRLFTASGHQKKLQHGQSIFWTQRGELKHVTPVARDSEHNNEESYRYDAGGQRVLKVSTQQVKRTIKKQLTLYLPGLEIRGKSSGDTEDEKLQVICTGSAGSTQARILNWTLGQPENILNNQIRYGYGTLVGSIGLELDDGGNLISMEEHYPYGGTAFLSARNQAEVNYKVVRYSGKERDATGLYYYDLRYYQPFSGRWLSVDPADTIDGINLFRFCRNNPASYVDHAGLVGAEASFTSLLKLTNRALSTHNLTDAKLKNEYDHMSSNRGKNTRMSPRQGKSQIMALDRLMHAMESRIIIYPQSNPSVSPIELYRSSGLQARAGYYHLISREDSSSLASRSRLNIYVNNKYMNEMTEALANLTIDNPADIFASKVAAYDEFSNTQESAVIYLNSRSKIKASQITEDFLLAFNKLLQASNVHVNDALVKHPAVAMLELQKGVHYKEFSDIYKPEGSVALEVASIIQQAVRYTRKPDELTAEKALKKTLEARGYSLTNPALVSRSVSANKSHASKRF